MSDEWPYRTLCKPQLTLDVECEEDWQCENYLFCWYKTAEEKAAGKTKCMESYSQEDGATFGWFEQTSPATLVDYERNG